MYSFYNLYLTNFLAAPKGTPMKTNRNQKNQKNLPQKRPRPNQKRRKQSPPRSPPPKLSRSQRLEKRNLKKKEMERPHPTPPTNPPTPTPTPAQTTNSGQLSNEEKVRKMWSNLDFDFAYSGNANDILNKIKSYRFVQLFGLLFIFIQCSPPDSQELYA